MQFLTKAPLVGAVLGIILYISMISAEHAITLSSSKTVSIVISIFKASFSWIIFMREIRKTNNNVSIVQLCLHHIKNTSLLLHGILNGLTMWGVLYFLSIINAPSFVLLLAMDKLLIGAYKTFFSNHSRHVPIGSKYGIRLLTLLGLTFATIALWSHHSDITTLEVSTIVDNKQEIIHNSRVARLGGRLLTVFSHFDMLLKQNTMFTQMLALILTSALISFRLNLRTTYDLQKGSRNLKSIKNAVHDSISCLVVLLLACASSNSSSSNGFSTWISIFFSSFICTIGWLILWHKVAVGHKSIRDPLAIRKYIACFICFITPFGSILSGHGFSWGMLLWPAASLLLVWSTYQMTHNLSQTVQIMPTSIHETPPTFSALAYEDTYSISGARYHFILAHLRRLFRHILQNSDSRKIAYFLSINFVFMFVEVAVGMATNSLGLVTDAGHMFFDNASLFIGLYAAYMSKWKPDSTFTYGYGRYETMAGFVNGIFLVFVAISVVMEGLERLWDPPMVKNENLLLVSVLGLLVNIVGLVFFHEHAHGHSHGHSHNTNEHDGSCPSNHGSSDTSMPQSTQKNENNNISSDASMPFSTNINGNNNISSDASMPLSSNDVSIDVHDAQNSSLKSATKMDSEVSVVGSNTSTAQSLLSNGYLSHNHTVTQSHDDSSQNRNQHNSIFPAYMDESMKKTTCVHVSNLSSNQDTRNVENSTDSHGHGYGHECNDSLSNGYVHESAHTTHESESVHEHSHGPTHRHGHELTHGHSHELTHGNGHELTHGNGHELTHGHGHSHSHSHSHAHQPTHGHSHSHSHGDSHSSHKSAHGHSHSHGHGHSNENLHGVFLHVLADALGSVGVIISSLLIEWYGWYWTDPLASLIIAVLILLSVWPFVCDTAKTLLVQVPDELEMPFRTCLSMIARLEGVDRIEDAHCWRNHSQMDIITINILVSSSNYIENVSRFAKKTVQEYCGVIPVVQVMQTADVVDTRAKEFNGLSDVSMYRNSGGKAV